MDWGISSLPRVYYYGGGNSSTTVRRSVESKSRECNIKGNISIDNGERILHVRGQRYYGETNPLYGERWFLLRGRGARCRLAEGQGVAHTSKTCG
jgi:hypothetical protein